MIKLIIELIGGALIGMFTMCILQVNNHDEIMKDSKEEK